MRGWIEDWSARSARDEALRRLLIGDVASVRYVEIDYAAGSDNASTSTSTSTPAWLGGAFDSIDYGVEVDYEDGRQVVVTWETPSWDEGMVLTEGTLQPDHVGLQADVCAWDVGERWQRRGGRRVVDVRSFWSRASYGQASTAQGRSSRLRACRITSSTASPSAGRPVAASFSSSGSATRRRAAFATNPTTWWCSIPRRRPDELAWAWST